MQDHLRDLGRELASELSTPLRLWRPRDLQYLESMGLKYILAKNDLRCFHSMFDESMSCQVTFFLGQPTICVEKSASLLWLMLDGKAWLRFQGIPSGVSLRYVKCLKIQCGLLKTVWVNRRQAPSQLKELQIEFCSELEELSFAHLSCLEETAIKSCDHLKSVLGINNLTTLAQLNISNCPELEELSLGHLSYLESITIVDCKHLKSVSGSPDLPSLLELNANDSMELVTSDYFSVSGVLNISNCPELQELKLAQLSCLRKLAIENCNHLKSVSGISDLENLQLLNISHCSGLEELSLGHLNCLETITLSDCKHLKSVSEVSSFKVLVKLHISECPELEELKLAQLSCLKNIAFENCDHLKTVSGISNLENLKLLNISHCSELEELSLGHLNCLETITLLDCKHLKSVTEVSSFKMLVKLNISECPELEDLSFAHLSCLEEIVIRNYSHLKNVSGLSNLKKLVQLHISECPELDELRLEHLTCLEKISIGNCTQLESVSGINDLAQLVELGISDCGKLEFECLRLSGMRCLETIIFDRSVKVKHFEVDDCQNIKTIIYGCEDIARFDSFYYSELAKLLIFENPICLVGLIINGCGKFKYLGLNNCQNLKTVSGNLEIGELQVGDCPELEELPRFPSLSCMKKIHIESCGKLKLQNIMLQSSLTSLCVGMCSSLQRVSTAGDLKMLTEFGENPH